MLSCYLMISSWRRLRSLPSSTCLLRWSRVQNLPARTSAAAGSVSVSEVSPALRSAVITASRCRSRKVRVGRRAM